MRKTFAALLTVALVPPAPAFAQSHQGRRWDVPDVAVEAKRLDVARDSGWARVARLAPGTQIVVRTRTLFARRPFLAANESELAVLNPHPDLPADASRELPHIVRRVDLFRLFEGRSMVVSGRVRIVREDVFVGDRRVARIQDVIERIPRAEVLVVSLPPVRRGSTLGALLGGGAGAVLGIGLLGGFMMKPCGRSCSDEQALAIGSLVGLPLAGATLGYYAVSRSTQTVLYRAS